MGNVLSAVPFVGLPVAAGAVIGMKMAPEIKGWYQTIKKPSWTPPNWLFGPVWTTLYLMMGVASHRVWRAGGGVVPMGLYTTQLLMNLAWSPLFFGAHKIGTAAVEMTGLLGVLAATMYEFDKFDRPATLLLVPYAAWSSYATALTYRIWQLNSGGGKKGGSAEVSMNKVPGKKAE